ncbi:MAG: 4-hydroxythreonine-4-phosphate dehydrogenase PdxA [Candidatus Omnitrophica bacterium]|nr:4-hydroxythreonine-4-phosphate dehydrogenase PdxA [Candidatus Omnitrophota bacterium]
MARDKPLIYITMGDPAGIGPEIIAGSMASPEIRGLAVFVVLADKDVMKAAFNAGMRERLVIHAPGPQERTVGIREDRINILDPGGATGCIEPGKPTDKGAGKALGCIETAVRLFRRREEGRPRALVTAPVDKSVIARVHPGFVGHTEYLRESFSSDMTTMVLIGETLRVVPVTRHIPVTDISPALSIDLITGTLEQVIRHRGLICGRDTARIGVCGLNPHCGEGGEIGREEIEIILPAIERARSAYPHIEGPVSADVAFYKAAKKEIDIVVSMYHDQCLAPFKMVDFDNGVNMTLGLDFMRTSPDHGTAFDIAGKGIASSMSMKNAIKLAVRAASAADDHGPAS